MKQERIRINVVPVEVFSTGAPLLAGSVTSFSTEVSSVDVEEFSEDSAFPSEGYETSFE